MEDRTLSHHRKPASKGSISEGRFHLWRKQTETLQKKKLGTYEKADLRDFLC